jgi:hypothetical protein
LFPEYVDFLRTKALRLNCYLQSVKRDAANRSIAEDVDATAADVTTTTKNDAESSSEIFRTLLAPKSMHRSQMLRSKAGIFRPDLRSGDVMNAVTISSKPVRRRPAR